MTSNVEDLIDRNDPGMALPRERSGRPDAHAAFFLARDGDLATRALLHLGVTTRSILGAIVFETGGSRSPAG